MTTWPQVPCFTKEASDSCPPGAPAEVPMTAKARRTGKWPARLGDGSLASLPLSASLCLDYPIWQMWTDDPSLTVLSCQGVELLGLPYCLSHHLTHLLPHPPGLRGGQFPDHMRTRIYTHAQPHPAQSLPCLPQSLAAIGWTQPDLFCRIQNRTPEAQGIQVEKNRPQIS